MNTTSIHHDPLNPEGRLELYNHNDDVGSFLAHRMGRWPSGARLYYQSISTDNDVTPNSPEEIETLKRLQGRFYVVVYPEGVDALVVIAIVAVVSIIAAFALTPKVPNSAQRQIGASSPNNSLSGRTNQARPNERIPDIFGTVRSTPDLISVPYSTYINNQEVENSLFCVGRGAYQIRSIKDSETLIQQINGSSIQVFPPFADISVPGTWQEAFGPTITEPILNITRQNSVNGQELPAPNENAKIWSTLSLYPKAMYGSDWAGTIGKQSGEAFTSKFNPDDVIVIEGLVRTVGPEVWNIAEIAPTADLSLVLRKNTSIPDDKIPLLRTINFGGEFHDVPNISDHALDGVYAVTGYSSGTHTDSFGTYDVWVLQLNNGNPASVNPEWNDVLDTAIFNLRESRIDVTYDQTPLYDFSGTYTVAGVSDDFMVIYPVPEAWPDFQDPYVSSIITDQDGNPLPHYEIAQYMSANIRKLDDVPEQLIHGPFTLSDPRGTTLITNFLAQGGLYKDDGKRQYAESVVVRLTIQPIDESGSPIGGSIIHDETITGSDTKRTLVGRTVQITLPFVGRVNVSAQRISLTDASFEGTVQDEIKWKDLYHASPGVHTYGNVTIIRSRTVATTAALALKERKLNCIATRKIYLIGTEQDHANETIATNASEHILNFVAEDPFIGKRTIASGVPLYQTVDTDNLLATVAAVRSYFGTTDVGEFCYTFDKSDITFEETVMAIANAIFCIAFRRGPKLMLSFEHATEDSTILFNHRNKVPRSEKRVVKFGRDKEYDGVEFIWVNPKDDSIETMSLPVFELMYNPQRVESIGIRNKVQATYHANRLLNKLKHQHVSVEFEAIATGELVVVGDRILVANNTNLDEQDGEVIKQVGFTIWLSQDVNLDPEEVYTIFLQMYDGSIQAIPINPVPAYPNAVQLTEPPIYPLVLDDNTFARTTYVIVKDSDAQQRAFLVTAREPGDSNTARIQAINYDPRYYDGDGLSVAAGLGYQLGYNLGGTQT